MNISCSARKPIYIHIRDWIDFELSHMKNNSGVCTKIEDVDYIFGNIEAYLDTPLYGGRLSQTPAISEVDISWAYDNNIGIKLPLTNKAFSEELYTASKPLIKSMHRKGNAVIVTTDKLAERIKNDFPLYNIELSAIRDIDTLDKLEKCRADLYDNIVLPISVNDDIEMLANIKNKNIIRLFINPECSYTCPNKVCYGTIGKLNSKRSNKRMLCSFYDLKEPRTHYNDNINWGDYYFNYSLFKNLGFSNFKLLPPIEQQKRTHIMYKANKL